MKNNVLNKFAELFTLLLASVVNIWFYGPIYKAPGLVSFVTSGDGLKNYFTLAYYVRNDKGALFTGMNYPFGEMVTYTDNQPLLAWILKWLASFTDAGNHVVGIQNILLIISPVIAAIFMSLVMKRYRIDPLFRIIGAVLIAYLSPQMFRMVGHYGLAYSWLIPMSWYMVLRFQESIKRQILWSISIFIFITLMSFVHPYNGVIAALFAGSFGLVKWLADKKWKPFLMMIIAAFSGIIIFLLIAKMLDGFEGRPKFPWGVYFYNADLEGFFAPSFGPLKAFFIEVFNTSGEIQFEKRMYLGIAVIIVLLSALFRLISQIPKWIKRKRFPGTFVPVKLIWWQCAVLFFIASSGAHKLGLDALSQIFPPIAQFRGLARLGWPIYFLIALYSVYWFQLWYRLQRMKHLKRTAGFGLMLILVIWLFDIAQYNKMIYKEIYTSNDLLDPRRNPSQEFFEIHNLNKEDFQAIWLFPIFLNGSEKLDKEMGFYYMRDAMQISFHTGIPIINIMMSRTPIPMSTSFLELYNPYIQKSRLEKFNDKPILVLGSDYESLEPEEKKILDRAEFIGIFNNVRIYKLNPDVINRVEFPQICADATNEVVIQDSLEHEGPVFYADFDDSTASQTYMGKGAFQSREEETIFFEQRNIKIPGMSLPYDAHIWVYVDSELMGMPEIIVDAFDEKGNFLQSVTFLIPKIPLVDGSWVRTSAYWTIHDGMRSLQFKIKGKGFTIDELMIHPLGHQQCSKYSDKKYRFNNIRIDQASD
ncbi:MAG: hypothetical protein IPI60_05670 [Saprospiraceae bacterium]|nr:hypothetical protein [Saprospiraceae bacterium]